MSARKLRPFAEILILEKELSPDQRLDLLDVLRGRPQRASKAKTPKEPKEPKEPKPPKETKEKPKKTEELFKAPICDTCGNEEDYADHSQPSPNYHPFTTGAKKKPVAGELK